jgi:hypothetical protein
VDPFRGQGAGFQKSGAYTIICEHFEKAGIPTLLAAMAQLDDHGAKMRRRPYGRSFLNVVLSSSGGLTSTGDAKHAHMDQPGHP